MAIHVRKLEEWRQLAGQVPAPERQCPRCADLGAAVDQLTAEVEQLRAPYATAFREGAAGALDFAARAFEALGEERSASLLRQMQGAVGS